jgi:hypothetical protein
MNRRSAIVSTLKAVFGLVLMPWGRKTSTKKSLVCILGPFDRRTITEYCESYGWEIVRIETLPDWFEWDIDGKKEWINNFRRNKLVLYYREKTSA